MDKFSVAIQKNILTWINYLNMTRVFFIRFWVALVALDALLLVNDRPSLKRRPTPLSAVSVDTLLSTLVLKS